MNFLNKLKWKINPPKTKEEYEQAVAEGAIEDVGIAKTPEEKYEALSGVKQPKTQLTEEEIKKRMEALKRFNKGK
jgi:hypothetical protein